MGDEGACSCWTHPSVWWIPELEFLAAQSRDHDVFQMTAVAGSTHNTSISGCAATTGEVSDLVLHIKEAPVLVRWIDE